MQFSARLRPLLVRVTEIRPLPVRPPDDALVLIGRISPVALFVLNLVELLAAKQDMARSLRQQDQA
ncbi:hypothetical protein [Thiobacillus sp.]